MSVFLKPTKNLQQTIGKSKSSASGKLADVDAMMTGDATWPAPTNEEEQRKMTENHKNILFVFDDVISNIKKLEFD